MVKMGRFSRLAATVVSVGALTACGAVDDDLDDVEVDLAEATFATQSLVTTDGSDASPALDNGSFEAGCRSWKSCSAVSAPVRAGAYAAHEALSLTAAVSVYQVVSAVAGVDYSASAWIAVRDRCQRVGCLINTSPPDPSVCSLRVLFRDGYGKTLGHLSSDGVSWPSGPKWQQKVVSGKAPAGTMTAQVMGRCTAGSGEHAYFDDFRFAPSLLN